MCPIQHLNIILYSKCTLLSIHSTELKDYNIDVCFSEETGEFKYAVLWSPRRFNYLYVYFYLVVFLCLVFLYNVMKQCKKEHSVPKYGYAYYRYKRIKNGVWILNAI